MELVWFFSLFMECHSSRCLRLFEETRKIPLLFASARPLRHRPPATNLGLLFNVIGVRAEAVGSSVNFCGYGLFWLQPSNSIMIMVAFIVSFFNFSRVRTSHLLCNPLPLASFKGYRLDASWVRRGLRRPRPSCSNYYICWCRCCKSTSLEDWSKVPLLFEIPSECQVDVVDLTNHDLWFQKLQIFHGLCARVPGSYVRRGVSHVFLKIRAAICR